MASLNWMEDGLQEVFRISQVLEFFLKALLGFLAAVVRPFGLAHCHAYIVNPIRLKQEPKESIRIMFLKA